MVRVRVRMSVGVGGCRVSNQVWCCLCWRDPGVIFDRVRAELFARNELSGAGDGAGWLGNGLIRQTQDQPYL